MKPDKRDVLTMEILNLADQLEYHNSRCQDCCGVVRRLYDVARKYLRECEKDGHTDPQ